MQHDATSKVVRTAELELPGDSKTEAVLANNRNENVVLMVFAEVQVKDCPQRSTRYCGL
ncbi:MAG: hypothetical protein OFPI_38450 [Osedax symbiont Rs2]|nr:MAG: hypothetical protein OFPI_38450 [Osedax symbiont Rs2]